MARRSVGCEARRLARSCRCPSERRLHPLARAAELVDLVPDLTDDLLNTVDQPLQLAKDAKGNAYLLCDYNRDGDSYRCAHAAMRARHTARRRSSHLPWGGERCSSLADAACPPPPPFLLPSAILPCPSWLHC